MKFYERYKDSGIDWIGEIPSGWDSVKVKYLFGIISGNGFKEELQGKKVGDYPFCKVSDINGSELFIKTANNYVTQNEVLENKYNLIPPNSILIAKIGEALKKNHRKINFVVCIVDNNLQALVMKKDILTKFAYYVSVCIDMIWFDNGGTIPSVNNQKLLNSFIPHPPITTQRLISDYLDYKTTSIDALITDKQSLIELLQEKRNSVISQAVTKGLDPTVPMKDSGVEWIDEIPAHWDVLSNHQLFVERNQKNTNANVELLSVTKYLGVILQSLAQELRLATTAPADSTEGYKIVKKGDLVMNIMRAKDGSYGISSYDGVISPAYCIYQARKKCNPQFLYYLFKTTKYVQIFKCYSTGIAEHRMRLYPEDFNKIPAILPPITEQDEIVKKLDAESKQIDEVIALIEQQIEKLKEYRLSIISEVVTGKVVV